MGVDGFCITTSLAPGSETRCGVEMSLSDEDLDAWFGILSSSGKMTISFGRFRLTLESTTEGGEGCPA